MGILFVESIRRLYKDGKITKEKVLELFQNGKITEEESKYILEADSDIKTNVG